MRRKKSLHDGLPDHLKRILEGKRLLLWKEILMDLGYPDASVVDDMISGFALTGWRRPLEFFVLTCVSHP